MALKAIFDIDVNDAKFREFKRLFDQYQAALKSSPAAWKLVNEKIDGTRSSFDKLVDKMAAENVQAKLREKAQERADKLTQTAAERWTVIARRSREFATNLGSAALSLLRIGSITGLVSGLAGAGGLFGIDRLAVGVAGTRRASLGLGTGFGEQRAFGTNFSRFVDPGSLLGGVSTALAGDRTALFGANLTSGQMGGSTAQVAVEVLKSVKRLVDQTDESMLGFMGQARRLGELGFGTEELRRLKRSSSGEFGDILKTYGSDQSRFNLPPDMAKQWQELTTQMSRAGQGIENTFVKGLVGLAPGLETLSKSVDETIRSFLSSPKLKTWVDGAGDALEKFARYIGTDDFQDKVKRFVDGVAKMADVVGSVASWFGGGHGARVSDRSHAHDKKLFSLDLGPLGTIAPSIVRGGLVDRLMSGPVNNPGNLRIPNSNVGFQQFTSPELGVAAMARQLKLYGNRDHLDTISAMISKYSPSSENNTAAYISDVSRKTGIDPRQHVDVNNTAELSKVIAAMISHEQSKGSFDKYKDAKVVVQVLNNTGGNAVVSVNGMKN